MTRVCMLANSALFSRGGEWGGVITCYTSWLWKKEVCGVRRRVSISIVATNLRSLQGLINLLG